MEPRDTVDTFDGKTAVITGGGGLLGRGMALAFAREGMHVVVADLDEARARATADGVEALGARAIAVQTDVTDRASVAALADRAFGEFGAVHLLCNNAGTAVLKRFEDLVYDDWDRVLAVQLGGVLNGVQSFLPRLIEQGGDRHIVNTSSMSGVGRADLRVFNAPYVTAKFAVVGLTEVMAPALAEHGIGVSVLCPGYTVPDPAGVTTFPMPSAAWYEHNLLDADAVAREVLHGIREERLYIFPHRAGLREVEGRHERLREGFAQAARTSPLEDDARGEG
ncbi:MAG TPA: SDR family NAD(P)-dependent oxidoreductase [Acidimicrobiia bacterium]|nr:SDR family NAD(P)-dependent oxidoreductase [Acidimicrobiia bacterium]